MVSQHALHVSRPTRGGGVERSGLGGSPGPHPRGKLRGLAWGVSRDTPWGGCRPIPRASPSPLPGGSPGPHLGGVSRPTPGGVSRPTPEGGIPACTEADTPLQQMATAAGGMHPTGVHLVCEYNLKQCTINKNL